MKRLANDETRTRGLRKKPGTKTLTEAEADRGIIMNTENNEVVPGLSSADVADMAEKVFNWTDGNHPQLSSSENGFLDILKNGKPDMSASPAFIRKAVL
jgi:hypothetical protein